MMTPAALSILTTTFNEGSDRNTALGAWGALAALAAAVGVFLGGVLSEGPGWRWVLLRQPADRACRCSADVPAAVRRRARGRRWPTSTLRRSARHRRHAAAGLRAGQSARGRLGHRADDRRARRRRRACWPRSWPTSVAPRTHSFPLSIFRIKGLAAADVTQLIAMAGFFVDVLLRHPVHAGGAALLADPGGRRLPPGHRRVRDLGRHLPPSCSSGSAPDRSSSAARCSPPAASTGSPASRCTARTPPTCSPDW